MSYGFNFISGFGSTLIDENHTCLRRINTHSVTTGAPNSVGVCEGTITVTGLPVGNYMALTSDSRFHTIKNTALSVGGYTITVYVESTVATTVSIIVLSDTAPPAGGSGTYGLEVLSSAGVRLFSTNTSNVALLGDTYLSAIQGTTVTAVNVATPSGRTLLLQPQFTQLGYIAGAAGQFQSIVMVCFMRKVSNTQFEFGFHPVFMIGAPITSVTQAPMSNYTPLFVS